MRGSTSTSGQGVLIHVIAQQFTINGDRQSPSHPPKFGPMPSNQAAMSLDNCLIAGFTPIRQSDYATITW
jgi:hypothetical protein